MSHSWHAEYKLCNALFIQDGWHDRLDTCTHVRYVYGWTQLPFCYINKSILNPRVTSGIGLFLYVVIVWRNFSL